MDAFTKLSLATGIAVVLGGWAIGAVQRLRRDVRRALDIVGGELDRLNAHARRGPWDAGLDDDDGEVSGGPPDA